MQELEDALDAISKYLPQSVQGWLFTVITIGVAIGILVKGLSWLGKPFSFIANQVGRLGAGERRHAAARREIFVDSILGRMEQINNNAEWADRRYTELEAEVEAEGPRAGVGLLKRLLFSGEGRRREKTLSRALSTSKHRHILLQGDPGSGKSVALRHVALRMALDAKRTTSRATLPLYVSLKDFRPSSDAVSTEDLKDYVLTAAADFTDARQAKYLREHFETGADAGTWFFLFDGFDEIPELLSAVEVDTTIRKYANAIAAFLNGVPKCRAVVASREYKGPSDDLPWPRFYLVSLSEQRKRKFIKRAHLDPQADRLLRTHLPNAQRDVRRLADNPMFLGLLCEFVEHERTFPGTTHAVFESHVQRALDSETDMETIFGEPKTRVREMAEQIAFCMSSDTGLGLSAPIKELESALRRNGFEPQSGDQVGSVAQALQYVRLARTEPSHGRPGSPPLSFSHRRFQEYFATCLVLKNPHLVCAEKLLTDGRWRETAVTVLQMHPPEQTGTLLATADRLMNDVTKRLDPVPVDLDDTLDLVSVEPFVWPPTALHLLQLLDAGLGTAPHPQARSIRDKAGQVLSGANEVGIIMDRKWALDVGGTAPDPVLLRLLRTSFKTGSAWLRETAFRQIGRIKPLPRDMGDAVCFGLLTYTAAGRLRRDWPALKAQVSNLDESSRFLAAMRLLLIAPMVDLLANVAWVVGAAGIGIPLVLAVPLAGLSIAGFYAFRGTTGFSWSVTGGLAPGLMRIVRGLAGTTAWTDTIVVAYFLLSFRLMAALIPFTAVWPTILFVYLFSWAFAALFVVRSNALNRKVLIWIFPQGIATHSLVSLFRKWLDRTGLKRFAVAAAGALTLLSAVTLGLYVISANRTAAAYALPVLLAGFLAVLAGILVSGSVTVVRTLLDYRLYRRYRKRTPSFVRGNDIVGLLESFRRPLFTRKVFALLRSNRTFARSPEVSATLRDIAWAIDYLRVELERALQRDKIDRKHKGLHWGLLRKGNKEKAPSWPKFRSPEVIDWAHRSGAKGRRRLRELGPTFLDELGHDIEQAEAR